MTELGWAQRTAAVLQILLALVLVGCGDDGDDSTGAARDPGDASVDATSAGGGGSSGNGSSDKDASKGGDDKHPVCGNGIVEASESCDDQNSESDDGCTPQCAFESGWTCSTDEPTTCTPRCGDGKRVGSETEAARCDDHNTDLGDGCDAQCRVEAGWSCNEAPSVCAHLCGNGALDPGEGCDDGNTKVGDGCAQCAVEPRWQCGAAPAKCTAELDANLLITGSQLAAFSTLDPASVTTPVVVSGLAAGFSLVAIDRRPQNGMLYGLGFSSSAGTAQLYVIASETGVASPLGAATKFTDVNGMTDVKVAGMQFGMDFDAVSDRLRVVNDHGQSFRINPNTGELIDANGGVAGVQPDGVVSGGTTSLDECAYTNNGLNAVVTTLYTLDHVTGGLYIQKPAIGGMQTSMVAISPEASYIAGFDIPAGVDASSADAAVNGSGFVALRLQDADKDSFAKINLKTGAITDAIPIGMNSVGMALQNTRSLPVYALSSDGLHLWRFESTNPSAAAMASITGVTSGEVLADIELRPKTGQLIAIGVNATSNTGTMYVLDPQSGAASVVGTASQIAFVDAQGASIDFPAAADGWALDVTAQDDRLRVIASTGLNFRVNPLTGAAIDGGAAGVAGTNPDGPISGLTNGATGISGAAFTNAFAGATATTLYVLDAGGNRLCHSSNPNAGVVVGCVDVKSGSQPLDVSPASELDLAPDVRVTTSNEAAAGVAYAVLAIGGKGHLFTIDLASGAADDLGQVGSGPMLGGIAVGRATVK